MSRNFILAIAAIFAFIIAPTVQAEANTAKPNATPKPAATQEKTVPADEQKYRKAYEKCAETAEEHAGVFDQIVSNCMAQQGFTKKDT
jgi:hypothetical protein